MAIAKYLVNDMILVNFNFRLYLTTKATMFFHKVYKKISEFCAVSLCALW